jgi:Xaa-Pro aminopeptidase
MSNIFVKRRNAAVRRLLKKQQADAYITLSILEQRYLSGVDLMQGEAVFLITARQTYGVTKQMLASKIAGADKDIKIHLAQLGGILDGALQLVRQKKLKKVLFDGSLVTLDEGEKLLHAGCVRCDGLLASLRAKKSADEAAKLKRACQIASDAFAAVKPQIKTGMTEDELSSLIATEMLRRGADVVEYNIVAFGENTADVHHMPSVKRKLKNNEAVLMDFGCFYQGYVSDMTRSWWHGGKEPAEYTRIWNLVDKARKAAIKLLKAGVRAGAVDNAARSIICAEGHGEEFCHTTGHGVGLYVHERPFLRDKSQEIVCEQAAVTIEPGIYFQGKWGIRLEDTFLVTKTGRKKLTY